MFFKKNFMKTRKHNVFLPFEVMVKIHLVVFTACGAPKHNVTEVISTFGYLALWQAFNTHTAR